MNVSPTYAVPGAAKRNIRLIFRDRRKRTAVGALLIGLTAASVLSIGAAMRPERRNGEPLTWRDYLGGADSSHYSALDQINRSNVGQLRVAWEYPTGDEVPYAFNPIIVDNVMFVMAKHESIVAMDAISGKQLWSFATGQQADIYGGVDYLGKRGINYWESSDRSDRRLLISLNDRLTSN